MTVPLLGLVFRRIGFRWLVIVDQFVILLENILLSQNNTVSQFFIQNTTDSVEGSHTVWRVLSYLWVPVLTYYNFFSNRGAQV